jgi:hypothetical protein
LGNGLVPGMAISLQQPSGLHGHDAPAGTKRPLSSQAFALSVVFCALYPAMVLGEGGIPALAPAPVPSFTMDGVPGHVMMPSALGAPDATLSSTVAHFGSGTRGTLTFQITPRLSGSFRYIGLEGLTRIGGQRVSELDSDVYYDRSFDLRYQLVTEGRYRPAVTIGLQDFAGTSLLGAEYIVASKHLTPQLVVTGGLGWGRLGSYRPLGRMGTRPTDLLEQGGVPSYDRWFRGDVAAFAGLTWAVTDRLSLKAEYSSDAYVEEAANGLFTPRSPWNIGLDYRLGQNTHLSVTAIQGAALGAQLTFHTNPRQVAVPGGAEAAPLPVARRSAAARVDTAWLSDGNLRQSLPAQLNAALERDGLVSGGVELSQSRATLRLINPVYGSEAQAIGRAARVMARVLPGTVETFVIVPVVNGMALSAVTLQRSDLEDLEHAPASALWDRTRISDAAAQSPFAPTPQGPAFTWYVGPDVNYSLFDPDSPLRADLLARARADYRITPGLVLSGSISTPLGGNLGEERAPSPSALPRVRTDFARYAREGTPALDHLTLTQYFRPGADLYGRVSIGYLERMFAGVSGEVLWKPVDSRLALGLEVNHVAQRDFDQGFGLRDYDVTTGHLSVYYDFGNGFHGQLDVGRYLAGDDGATFSLDREFANGWRIGAFATLTNVSAEDFGEGSFDKGIRLTIPISAVLGQPTRRAGHFTVRPVTRDGGARLNLRDRLYPQVRDYHSPELEKTWGRVWR